MMRKFLTRVSVLALSVSMLATSALAATMSSDKFTYNLSNESTGTVEFQTEDMDGQPISHTVYLVPVGTVVTRDDGSKLTGSCWFDSEEGWMGDALTDSNGHSLPSVTIEVGKIYNIETEDPMFASGIGPGLDEGIWLKASEGAGSTVPSAPIETTKPAETTKPVETTTPAETVKPTETVAANAPGTYTVKQGDTMGKIAVNYYGSYGYHKALYQANAAAFQKTGGKLTPGMVLTLPATLGKATLVSAPVAGAGETLYTVKAGDTLGGIAKATYGDVMKYQAIFARNADRLTNANTIYEGQVIVLPAK